MSKISFPKKIGDNLILKGTKKSIDGVITTTGSIKDNKFSVKHNALMLG